MSSESFACDIYPDRNTPLPVPVYCSRAQLTCTVNDTPKVRSNPIVLDTVFNKSIYVSQNLECIRYLHYLSTVCIPPYK